MTRPGSESTERQPKRAGRNIVAWIVLVLGFGALLFAFHPRGRQMLASEPHTHWTKANGSWLGSLRLKQIQLPAKDLGGREFPLERPYFLLSGPCGGCWNGPTYEELVSRSRIKPVVFVTADSELASRLKQLKDARVLIDLHAKYVPVEMIDAAPQVGLVERGVITRIPNDDETLQEFLSK